MGINQLSTLEHILITTKVEKVMNWSRATSVWPVTFGLACCAIEMMAAGASRFDFDRFGAGIFRATPRQADLMIVAGTVTYKMAPIIKTLYDQMPEPKWVIALGSCALVGPAPRSTRPMSAASPPPARPARNSRCATTWWP